MTPNRDLAFCSEVGFFKLKCQVLAKIGTALHAIAPASTTLAEYVAEAKELAEDVAEILEYRGIESRTLRGRAAESGMAIAIVHGALLRICEHGIGLADFLEPLFRVRIVGIS